MLCSSHFNVKENHYENTHLYIILNYDIRQCLDAIATNASIVLSCLHIHDIVEFC